MPRTRRNAAAKKRRPRRKRVVRTRRARFSRLGVPSGMPRTRRANLRYCDQISLTCSAGVLASYVFRANSVYDPDQTSTGHQPMGYDTWATLYNHYVVLGAKITVSMGCDTSAGSPMTFGTYLTDTTTVPYSSWQAFREARKGTMQLYLGRQSSSRSVKSLYSAKKFFAVKDVVDNVQRLGAEVTANPSEEALFVLWYQNLDGATDTQYFAVTIDYIVEFSEPKDLAQS